MGLGGFLKFLAVSTAEILVVVLLVVYMPHVPPHCKIEESYTVTQAKPFEGKLALNERLNDAEIWHKGDLHGPETFADFNGELYTTLHGGDVVKLTGEHITPVVKFGKPCKGTYQEKICGRPLGMNFDKSGNLIVSDAYYGIFKVDMKTGDKVLLVSRDEAIGGRKPKLPNSVAAANNGDIYWTDSSTNFELQDGVFDLFADGSGRLVHYDAKTKRNTVLLDNLFFANGVALSADEDFVIVAETSKSRLHRCYVKGPKKGKCDIFTDGLPGMPDNLKADGQGGFLVPLVVTRDDQHPLASQILGPFPLIRKFIARLFGLTELGFKAIHRVYPNEFTERAIHFVGHFQSTTFLLPHHRFTLLHISNTGEIIDSLHALDKKFSGISEAHIFKDHLYLGSPFNDYIVRVPLQKAGLTHLAVKRLPVTQVPVPTRTSPTPVQALPTPAQTPPVTKDSTSTTQSPPVKQATPSPKQTSPTKVPSTTQAPPPPPSKQTPSSAKQAPPPASKPMKVSVDKVATQKPTDASKPVPTEKSPVKKAPSRQDATPQVNAAPSPVKATPIQNVEAPLLDKESPPSIKDAPSVTAIPLPVTDTPTVVKDAPTIKAKPSPIKATSSPIINTKDSVSPSKETMKPQAAKAFESKQAPPLANDAPAKETKTTK